MVKNGRLHPIPRIDLAGHARLAVQNADQFPVARRPRIVPRELLAHVGGGKYLVSLPIDPADGLHRRPGWSEQCKPRRHLDARNASLCQGRHIR